MNAEIFFGVMIIRKTLGVVVVSIIILYRFFRSTEIESNDIDYIVVPLAALVPEIFLLAFLMYLISKTIGKIQ